jgi:hypothetical protein
VLEHADVEDRLRGPLAAVYGYYGRVEPELGVILRDAELVPALRRVVAEDATNRQRIRDSLAAGWGVRGGRRRLLLAAIGTRSSSRRGAPSCATRASTTSRRPSS